MRSLMRLHGDKRTIVCSLFTHYINTYDSGSHILLVCVCVCVCVFVCFCLCVCGWICVCVGVFMWVYVSVCMCTCTLRPTSVCVHVCTDSCPALSVSDRMRKVA